MEALGALAFVCNILQLIEQGTKLVTDCRETSKHGSSHEIRTIEALDKLSTDASATWQQASAFPSSTAIDREIEKCARSSATAATELHQTVLRIRYKDGVEIERSSLSKAWKARRSLAKIKEQKDAFSDVQLLLQTTLLTAIREDIQSNGDQELKRLISMDKHIQDLLNATKVDGVAARNALGAISGVQAQLKDLVNEVRQQTQNVVDKLDSVKLDSYKREAVSRLVAGLEFDGMYARENEIRARVNKYGETARWIFGDFDALKDWREDRKRLVRDVHARFETWLRNGTGIWFVEGKPGSGKSSLMLYVRNNLKEEGRAHHLLTEWAQGAQCAVLSFFFFRPAASRLAKSYEGLWRSLCLQILDHDGDLPGLALNDPNAPRSLKRALSADQPLPKTWRTDELETWFFYLLFASKSYVLILLDGLDEFMEFDGGDEGHKSLLETVQAIDRDNSNVKLICSARPDQPFKHALRDGPYFKLQDANYSDIVSFADSTLKHTKASVFARSIAAGADGVFLWAHIVANDLAKAARANASLSQLKERFEHCPKEMHDLSSHLIARQDDFYRKNPQPILWLFHLYNQVPSPYSHSRRSRGGGLSLFELLLLAYSDYSLEKLFQILQEDFSHSLMIELIERAQGFGDEMVDCCGGLLTIVGPNWEYLWPAISEIFDRGEESMHHGLWLLFRDQKVDFVHRTAQEFLHEAGATLLAASRNQMSDSESLLLLAGAYIGILGFGDGWSIPGRTNHIADRLFPSLRAYIDMLLTDADYKGNCHQALDLFVNLLARRITSGQVETEIGYSSWEALFDWYPTCCELPLKLRLSIGLAGAYGNIVDSFVVPIIEHLDERLRPLAAAFTFVRSLLLAEQSDCKARPVRKWRALLHMSSPFTELPLWYHIPRQLPENLDSYQRPLWLHFFTYGFFNLAHSPKGRSQAWEIANEYFELGVSRKEICVRCISFHGHLYGDRIDFGRNLGWSSERSALGMREIDDVDAWMIEQAVDDLPSGSTWRIVGKVRRYSPTATRIWLRVPTTAAEGFVFDVTQQLDREGRERWQLTSKSNVLQASVNVVNHHLDTKSGKLRKTSQVREDMQKYGRWGFSKGRVCHHPDEGTCRHCGLDESLQTHRSIRS